MTESLGTRKTLSDCNKLT